jgi:RND family efflux transporter MFP subunit
MSANGDNNQPQYGYNAEDSSTLQVMAKMEADERRFQKEQRSEHQMKKTGRIIMFTIVVLAAALAVGFFFVHARKSAAESDLAKETADTAAQPVPVDVVRVQLAPPFQLMTLPGETAGWYESTVYARVSGYIRDWKVDIGDKVVKGQLMCDIETPELDADLTAAQAKLNASQAEVTVEKANADFAVTSYERWWNSPKGYVSEQEKQEKKAQRDSGLAKVASAEAQVKLDQANVERLDAMEAFKKVVAPYDGVVTQRRIDIGDLVTAGSSSSTTSLYAVAQADEIRTFIDVPQRAATGISVGMLASITDDENTGRRFDGKVARTANAINVASRTLRVEVDLPNPGLLLMPGMYVNVAFQLKQSELTQVPASAMVFREKGPQVAVVSDDNRVQFHDVKITRDEGDVVEIGSGIKPNDRVALNISSEVGDGDTVAPNEANATPTSPSPAPVALIAK